MPTNKNAFIRYKYLDRLLSDRHHYYDINDLTEKVNDMMARDKLGLVKKKFWRKKIRELNFFRIFALSNN